MYPINYRDNYEKVHLGLSNKQSNNLFFKGEKRDFIDITNKSYFDRYYNKAYLSYKEINKQYENLIEVCHNKI